MTRIFHIVAATVLVACGQAEPPRSEQVQPPETPDQAPPAPPWTVTVHGLGPIRAGMTPGEAEAAAGRALGSPIMGSEECGFAWFASDTAGGPVAFMIFSGRIARVDVRDTSIQTAEGARIGDSETRIAQLYAGRVDSSPHKYVDGRYLTVTEPGDTSHAIVFETDGSRVTRYRAGRMPEVRWVEGCS